MENFQEVRDCIKSLHETVKFIIPQMMNGDGVTNQNRLDLITGQIVDIEVALDDIAA